MSEWQRSTRRLALEEIPPEMRTTLNDHLVSFNLGPIVDDYLVCVETTSRRRKKGLFGGGLLGAKLPKHTVQISIVTPRWLVICMQSEDRGSTAALSVPLEDAVVEDYGDTTDYSLIADCGVYVTGAFTGRVGMQGHQRIRYFIGLGEEAVAGEFKDVLFRAVEKTRKPGNRGLP